MNWDSVEQNVWIESAPFCAMPHINGESYLAEHEDLELNPVGNVRKNNAEFHQTFSPDGPADIQSPQTPAIRAFGNIDVGKELYYVYCSSKILNT